MGKNEDTVFRENRLGLLIAEFVLITVSLLLNYDLTLSVHKEHWQPYISQETAFIAILVTLGFLHFTEPKRVARHRNMYFRNASRQSLVLGTVISFSICMQHFKICQKLQNHEEDKGSILAVYRNYSFSMSIAALFYGILYLFNVDIAFIAPVIALSLGLLQDHFSDINFIVPLGAMVLYMIVFLGLIKLCPKSFTIAEGVMISQGATFMMTDFSLLFILKFGYKSLLHGYNLGVLENRSSESLALSALLMSTIVISICLSPVFYCLAWYTNTKKDGMIYSVAFYVGGIMNVFAVFIPLMYIVLEFNPLWYVLSLMTLSVTILIMWWIFLLVITFAVIIWKANGNDEMEGMHLPNIIIRKFFHIIAILIFVPGIYIEPTFTKLASGIAMVVLIICEYFRIFKIYPFGEILDRYLITFVDDRDSGKVILTHIYLLFGFALPVWLFPFNEKPSPCVFLPYSGVISLGFGDSLASIVGKYYGKWRIAGSSKTYIGVLACIVSQFLALITLMVCVAGYISLQSTIKILFAVCLTALMECVTSQIDNLVLSPVLYMTLAFLFDA